MRFEYDAEVDILMVELGDVKARRHRTERLPNGAVLDLAEDGTILAIEIQGASRRYPVEELCEHPVNYEEPIGLAEAACAAGCTPKALQLAIQRGRLKGMKIGRNWTTTIKALHEYLDSRKHGGPGAVAVAERAKVTTIRKSGER